MGIVNGMILTALGLVVAISLFLGFATLAKKAFNTQPHSTVDSTQTLSDQKRRMETIQRQQEDLMRQQKQRIKDLQRRQR
jgi:hypothetical protein